MINMFYNSVIFNESTRHNSKLDHLRMEAVFACDTCGLLLRHYDKSQILRLKFKK